MPITAPHLAHQAGVPGQWSDTISPTPEGLIAGDTPHVVTVDRQFAASQTIAAYTPVGEDASGNLVPALTGSVDPADDIQAIGITLAPITVGATPLLGGPVLIAASVALDMLNWPASFDTDAKKLAAFNGAPTPTNIVVRVRYRGATVANP
ncbi:hypothetical protein D2N39_11710 [Gemmobacter lutimaris]|jgi:hypothetical protein|uniref:Head decoration protein n=1 Tax=Gemmobacter lutimaris TaxID=2306023 RepID=A0A398BQA6_9RHOB|nr:head decoration protein [Gemmobacter lutimaris]RID91894.1 hypothetical protein D2N39_11710 [Gemmobacter lutimaris]